MAMTGAGLSADIKGKITAVLGPALNDAELQQLCDALGEAIVEYIQANAVVTTSGPDAQTGTVHSTGTVG